MLLSKTRALIVLCSFFSVSLFAQNANNQYFIPTVFNKSPNSSAFTKYGEYPTDLFTGLPEISIPLYTVQSGGLSMPISISYHASGIKVDQVASYIGLGWTLNATGAITRTIYGKPDEGDGGGSCYFFSLRPAESININSNSDATYLYETVKYGGHDNRPDIFTYNFPGHSGKFFFNAKDGYNTELIPYSPIIIKNTAVSRPYDKPRFAILDEHGNSFTFGYNVTEKTLTRTVSQVQSNGLTAWMLENMISQNKHDTISFIYQEQSLSLPAQRSQVWVVEDRDNSGHAYAQNPNQAMSSDVETTVNEQDPSEIKFKNGKVVFKLKKDPNGHRTDFGTGNPFFALDSINVYMYDFATKKYETRPQKSIIFHTSYFTAFGGAAGRLRLDDIEVLDKAGSIVQRYRFSYNNAQLLPEYTSFSKDFWGYYNGKADVYSPSNTLIPKTSVSVQPLVPGASSTITIGSSDPTNRDADSVKMQAAILTKIEYPTGGYTEFAFEANRYTPYQTNVPRITGGLRIKSISSFTGAGAIPIVKTYQYNDAVPNFVTNGVSGFIDYGFFMHEIQVVYNSGGVMQYTKYARSYYSQSSGSVMPSEGNPVAYKKVTEYTGTPTTNIGKTEYEYIFRQDDYAHPATDSTEVPVILDYNYARGLLKSKVEYLRKSDGTYQVAHELYNTYSAFKDTVYKDVGMVVGNKRRSEGSVDFYLTTGPGFNDDRYYYPFKNYSIVSGDNKLIATDERLRDSQDPSKFSIKNTEYKYDNFNHQQVSRVRESDSKSKTRVTVNRYPADYLIGAATSTNNITLDSMIRKNMQADLVEKWDSVNSAITGGQINLYQFNNYSIVPYQIKKLVVTSPLTNFTPAYVSSGNISADSRYQQMISFAYDSNGNLIQYTPKNAGPSSIIWDYNNALPVAQITNAQPNGIYYNSAYTGFEADGKGNWYFNRNEVIDPNAPTGKVVHLLSGAPVYFYNADLTKPHVVSYWSSNGVASVTINGTSYPGIKLKTINGYTLYRHNLPAISGYPQITISGSLNIDELKTYPADAQMNTYAYDTNGITHTADAKDLVAEYEYDEAQRLKNQKDWQGNIVKSYGYHNYDMTVGNDAIPATTFTRNNCPANTVPGSTTYSVAANQYYSSTKISANKLADFDFKTNGQAKANDPAICGCDIQYVTFTATNSTGIGSYQADFSGPNSANMPINATGTTTKQIPAGTYTVVVAGAGTQIKTFSLAGSTISGRGATFTNVVIQPGSTTLTLSIY